MWSKISEAQDYGGRGLGSIALTGGATYEYVGARALLATSGLGGGLATAAAMTLPVHDVMPDCIDLYRRTETSSRTIPQCHLLIEAIPGERNPLYEVIISRQSRKPYDFEYSKPGYTFTGISCLPVSAEIQSPDAEVISGGLNCSSVTIRLTPLEEGEWECRVVVYGRLSTAGPSAEESEQVAHFMYEKTISRRSREPFDYEYSKPGYTFTEISCLPVSREIPSPDVEVIKGGINRSSVTIRLTPAEEGEWACLLVVNGKLGTAGPSADVPKQDIAGNDFSTSARRLKQISVRQLEAFPQLYNREPV